MTAQPYDSLTPDTVIDAVESLGYLSDLRIFPLNSYENRVYQIGIENADPLIAKFYRPGRWRDEEIQEEHSFSLALHELDVPLIPPMQIENETLFRFKEHRFALYPRRGGHAPELDNLDTLFNLAQHLGRLHQYGKARVFEHRPTIDIQSFAIDSRSFLLENNFIPNTLLPAYESVTQHVIEKLQAIFKAWPAETIRLHGDCHPGNIIQRDENLYLVDLDDCRNGPAIQDLWMLLSGDRFQRSEQLECILEGYEEFCEFNMRELHLIEALRSMRLMHYAAWLARRWQDPAFPQAFPWFNTERYWSEHVLELREQLAALEEESLKPANWV